MLQEVHVEVIVGLHCFLGAYLEDTGEIACHIEAQVHHWIANTKKRGEHNKLESSQ